MILHWLTCIVYNSFFPLVLHARRQCLNVNEEQPISRLIEDQTHCYHLLAWKIEFDPQWTDIECTLLKPAHYYLQACTANLLNMEGVVCKSTNS
jgi:hypothetical protein